MFRNLDQAIDLVKLFLHVCWNMLEPAPSPKFISAGHFPPPQKMEGISVD